MQQLIGLADSGIAEHYVSVMPDVHLGKGATVGTVFASSNFVAPNAVGVDIGCGMCAAPIEGLKSKDLTLEMKEQIFQLIKEKVPVGFSWYETPLSVTNDKLEQITEEQKPTNSLIKRVDKKAKQQLGTLGGGNHFLEVLRDQNDQVWLMLHSGSRNIGKTTAEYYNQIAMQQMQKIDPTIKKGELKAEGLNYLRIDSEEGQDYLRDMEWC